jgi:hypothetical protein
MSVDRSVTATFEPEDQAATDNPDSGQDDEDDGGSRSPGYFLGFFLSTLWDFLLNK